MEEISVLFYCILYHFILLSFVLFYFSKNFHERPRLIIQLYIISLIVFLNLKSLKMI